MLQQHGYFVLRFLAEDLGKRLDDVLDSVITALANRRDIAGAVQSEENDRRRHGAGYPPAEETMLITRARDIAAGGGEAVNGE